MPLPVFIIHKYRQVKSPRRRTPQPWEEYLIRDGNNHAMHRRPRARESNAFAKDRLQFILQAVLKAAVHSPVSCQDQRMARLTDQREHFRLHQLPYNGDQRHFLRVKHGEHADTKREHPMALNARFSSVERFFEQTDRVRNTPSMSKVAAAADDFHSVFKVGRDRQF